LGRTAYVLPIRWEASRPVEELTRYLAFLASHFDDVIVVDGSPRPVFADHHRRWGRDVVHIAPDPGFASGNGKVQGVRTGIARTTADSIVIGDDDVRYDGEAITRVLQALEVGDLAWPQNYFDPLPWHARWDTARTLLNRSLGCDFPGTVAVRRHTFLAIGGYDGDVLWENLELRRTVEAAGGKTVELPDVFVRRLPPTTGHFWSQRTRQAYDELARPGHLALELTVVPAALLAARRPRVLLLAASTTILLAELGRRRSGGRSVFPATLSLFAPAWVLERGVCVWLAVGARVRRGGVRYQGTVLRRAATPTRELRARLAGRVRARV
jgi:hypothetical protein